MPKKYAQLPDIDKMQSVAWTDELTKAIAAIIICCAEIDDLVSRRLFQLSKMKDIDGFMLIGQMGQRKKSELLSSLTHKNDPSDLMHVKGLRPKLATLFSGRNAIAHGVPMGQITESRTILFLMRANVVENEQQFGHHIVGYTENQIISMAHAALHIRDSLEEIWRLPPVVSYWPRGSAPGASSAQP